MSLRPVEVNGGPGALFLDDRERLIAVWALDVTRDQVTGVQAIINPDKQAHLGPVADFQALLAQARSAE
jgi:hypothetical protein